MGESIHGTFKTINTSFNLWWFNQSWVLLWLGVFLSLLGSCKSGLSGIFELFALFITFFTG